MRQKLHAAHAGHADVGHNAADRTVFQSGEEFCRGGIGSDVEPFVHQEEPDRIAKGVIVIDHVNDLRVAHSSISAVAKGKVKLNVVPAR